MDDIRRGNSTSFTNHEQPMSLPGRVRTRSKMARCGLALKWIDVKARMAGTACLAPCICLATLAYKKRKCPKTVLGRAEVVPKAADKQALLHRSMSIAALHGGKMALERILDAQQTHIDEKGLAGTVEEMRKLISAQPIHFNQIHRAAAKLEMSGREDDAIKLLIKALHRAQKKRHSLEAYEFEMLLVEMLIYKGDISKALLCKCLKETDISDARVPLYKAIIYTMLHDKTCAKKYYEDFQIIRQNFHWPDGIEEGTPMDEIVLNFEDFEHVVENLNKEIEHAHDLRAK